MRIDAHHHFWDVSRYNYKWMTPELSGLPRRAGPEQLQPILTQFGFDRSILVQTLSLAEETRWFLELAAKHSFIASVVGWADLASPSIGDILDVLAQSPKLVGLRHQVHDEPDVNWLLGKNVQRGLRELSKRKLTFDLLLRPPHLAPALQIAQTFPELSLVVDHIAKPSIAKKGWDDWAGGIAALGQCPNVWCKLSGMITEADWAHWKAGDLQPYVNYILESFGPERVLFGSDWPVCLLAGSYEQVVDALAQNLASLTHEERNKIFGSNAVEFYGLKTA
jgi:L-fuconolactonase